MCTFDAHWRISPGDFTSAARVRVEFRQALLSNCAPSSDVGGAEIIFGELVTNALRHGKAGADVTVRCKGELFALEIADDGPGFDLESVAQRERVDDGGRGLMIADRLGARLRAERRSGKWVVEAVLPVACSR
jgi:anti-sigma regulatory factor (Ser/Thr protein kinase)